MQNVKLFKNSGGLVMQGIKIFLPRFPILDRNTKKKKSLQKMGAKFAPNAN